MHLPPAVAPRERGRLPAKVAPGRFGEVLEKGAPGLAAAAFLASTQGGRGIGGTCT
eukprot:CAMPEP_0206477948 /NCGR_PEP_ID=MMETSP0324_2-20121206/35751_1 /ASSEMBLY_ACC=CAM_ASM_000836 /TAXON_ID=2866 /ORGANISM="Crypthecodinium cohnii, Strain Seligo" /LENGTH=55 /DNA_ID=CAMNT_0053954139 /DNA_START=79 /DNA_END=246 /DNA_ORIENTATION=-